MSDSLAPPVILYEKAKSARASCKKCGEKIDKDAPRIGIANPQHKTSYLWYHPQCSFLGLKSPKTKNGLSCKISKQKIHEPLINLGGEKLNVSVSRSSYNDNFCKQVKSDERELFYIIKQDGNKGNDGEAEIPEEYVKAIRGELEGTPEGVKRPREEGEEKEETVKKEEVTEASTSTTTSTSTSTVVKEEMEVDLEADQNIKSSPPPSPSSSPTTKSPKKKKAKANPIVVRTERTPIPSPIALPPSTLGTSQFKVVSWNVAGLRGLLNKSPTALIDLAESTKADLICLQEHKLQDIHVVAPEFSDLLSELGYDVHWAVSTSKKGYSGVACFCLKSSPFGVPSVSHFPNSLGVAEGRSITLQYPSLTITNVYTPNSGQSLDRLPFRTKTWDTEWLSYQNTLLKSTQKPVMWLGDLNVAHKPFDVWNEGAKHHPKQAGLTKEEREGFTKQLEGGYFDAFRYLHPDACGHYSYWSARSKAREPNKGLRLDYFVCSEDMKEDGGVKVLDCYMDYGVGGSDHGPVVCVLEGPKAEGGEGEGDKKANKKATTINDFFKPK
ncbi:hypothetical protein TrST_g9005 [Triparma strigata]|uniref:DNA-(apurinic or apyrimidinic site) endonuclease n=1 Tax=Triparma strigata TaxID=1606541 RepID=A0A9W7BGY0_9STRA|nr:hypothetical protein TrST_g9005 [Triparma strigata]